MVRRTGFTRSRRLVRCRWLRRVSATSLLWVAVVRETKMTQLLRHSLVEAEALVVCFLQQANILLLGH